MPERAGDSHSQAPSRDPTTLHEVNDPNEEFALGLNKDGFIIFMILLFVCLPICWLPFVMDKYKVR